MPTLEGLQGAAGSTAYDPLQKTGPSKPSDPPGSPKRGSDSLELSPEAQRRLAELKATDARVRAHEAAHLAAAGGLAKGGANFTYERGPDGQQYAIGGEVSIDTSGVPGNPRATLAKAQQIQRAALAPGDPSPQDRAVAAAAAALASQASRELLQEAGKGAGGEGAKAQRIDLRV